MIPETLAKLARAFGPDWYASLKDNSDTIHGKTGHIVAVPVPYGALYAFDVYSPFSDLDTSTRRLFIFSGHVVGGLYRYELNSLPSTKYSLERVKRAIGGLARPPKPPKKPKPSTTLKRQLTPRNPNWSAEARITERHIKRLEKDIDRLVYKLLS